MSTRGMEKVLAHMPSMAMLNIVTNLHIFTLSGSGLSVWVERKTTVFKPQAECIPDFHWLAQLLKNNLNLKHPEHHPKTFVTWFELMFSVKHLMDFYIFTQSVLIEVVCSLKLPPLYVECGSQTRN